MALDQPFPDLHEILATIGAAGERLGGIDASEGAAGNLSLVISHIPAYRDQDYINQQLLRWEAETIVNLPEGIGVLPYKLPGSPAMMEANVAGLRDYRIVVWSKHGVMARSDISVTRGVDRIEYAETAAMYEYMNLINGNRAEGLTRDELREVVESFNVQTTLV